MSHDIEAAYASSEVADLIMVNQRSFFGTMEQQEHGPYLLVAKEVTNGRLPME